MSASSQKQSGDLVTITGGAHKGQEGGFNQFLTVSILSRYEYRELRIEI